MTTLKLRVAWLPYGHITVALRRECDSISIRNNDYACRENNGFTICRGFSETNRISDVDRYRIGRSGNRITLIPHDEGSVACVSNRYNDILPCSNEDCGQTLVIILESPHKEEYCGNCLDQPIAPAQGNTGSNLCGWLDRVHHSDPYLRDHVRDQTRIIISNPVQYQASLAAILCLRGKKPITIPVWRKLWECEMIKNDFIRRMVNYQPDFIINVCTSDISENVKCFLQEKRSCLPDQAKTYKVHHPSVWHRKERRKLTEIAGGV